MVPTPTTILPTPESARPVTSGSRSAAARPISTRLEPVLSLEGVPPLVHTYCTFPSCLPDPDRLAVPTRPVVVGAAPTFSCVSRVRLPPASAACCDRPQVGPFIPTRYRRLVAHVASDRARCWSRRPVRFPGPLPEPDVRLSPHPALHRSEGSSGGADLLVPRRGDVYPLQR